jgi:hypothetical protein
MGFNLIGAVLSGKFADKRALCRQLGIGEVNLIDEQAIFESASSSYAMGDLDVYITEIGNGTFITTGIYINVTDVIPVTANGGKAMRFLMGDTAGLYNFFYAENGKGKRSLEIEQGVIKDDRGNKLAVEPEGKDISAVIFDLIGEITGMGFWSIEPDHTTALYRRV